MRRALGIAYADDLGSGIEAASATVVDDLRMLVTLTTGETRLFDASPLLKMPAFAPLANPGVFRSYAIDHGVVCWPDGGIDLAPEKMYTMSCAHEQKDS